jgi:hypothetical protein
MATLPTRQLQLGVLFCCSLSLLLFITIFASKESCTAIVAWSAAQWMPVRSLRNNWQEHAWRHWQQKNHHTFGEELLATVNVQDHLEDLLPYLEETYGMDWRRRPVLLKGLWSPLELSNSTRRLSLKGLLQENLTIPYFTDARLQGALTPDSRAPVREVVANITRGAPHKIGTQFVVQTYPEIIQEVAPVNLVTELFGNYFTPESVKGTGPFHFLPALTTVPLFIANGKQPDENDASEEDEPRISAQPYTALHCEPIGNVAVQLSGHKQWTLVRPEFSYLVKPSISPDGRAFYASWASDYANVPTYSAITEAGDAIWVPTWTWHRVDYMESDEVAIGGSLFHFRALDFVRNNPLFAVLIVPSLLKELVGYNTQ